MNWSETRQSFRALLEGEGCVTLMAVFDPVSARIAELLNVEAAILPGSLASFTVLGRPDLALITLSELAEQALRICRSSRVPLLIDGDHGYGNALNVMRTVQELEIAGVAALTIEDTVLPVTFGATDRMQLVPLNEAVGKLRAALAARSDSKLAILGRTSAAAANGTKDLIGRVEAYAATGVDALFLSGVTTRHQLDAVSEAIRIPLVLGLAPAELADVQYLASRGVRLNHVGSQSFEASVLAMHTTMKAMRQGIPTPEHDRLEAAQLTEKIMRNAIYADWKRDFLS